MAKEIPQQSMAKRTAGCTKAQSSLVRRLIQAYDDPAKQRIRRWLSDISDERLLTFGLTTGDIALLRGAGSGTLVNLGNELDLVASAPSVCSDDSY
jgi:hypothetical protein